MPRRKIININPNRMEIEECDRTNVVSAPRRNRTGTPSTEAKRKQNKNNMILHFVRKVEANFYRGAYLLTIESVGATVEEAKKNLAKYRRRLKALYTSNNTELMWIAVLHRGENGRLHYHIIINAAAGIDSQSIKDKWTDYTGGYSDIERVRGWDGLRTTAVYMIKGALQCDPTDPEYRKGARAYSGTHNLISPVIEYVHITRREFDADVEHIDGMYIYEDIRYVDSGGYRHHNYTYRSLVDGIRG